MRTMKALVLSVLIPCPALMADSLALSADVEEWVEAVSDTASLDWEGRWTLSEKLMMASLPAEAVWLRLLVNQKALEAHNANFEAYLQRLRLLQSAEHLTPDERAAAIRTLLGKMLKVGFEEQDALLRNERLRAHIYGLDALFSLESNASQREEARRLARHRLDEGIDCTTDWIFLNFLAQTSATIQEEYTWYEAGQARCAWHKLKTSFYDRMLTLLSENSALRSDEDVGALLEELTRYLGMGEFEDSEAARVGVEKDGSPDLVARFHCLLAQAALDDGNEGLAIAHIRSAEAAIEAFRADWMVSGGERAALVRRIDALSEQF